jgi:hypothetical protein
LMANNAASTATGVAMRVMSFGNIGLVSISA